MTYTYEDHLKNVALYNRTKTVQLTLRLNKEHDADIIKQLDIVGNKQGYIKKLIRDDIGKGEP